MKKEPLESMALVFVYNANSGFFNTAVDLAHKIFSPQTYQCKLCALTHSPFGMRKRWQEFLKDLEVPLEFLHADELQTRYFIKGLSWPVIFQKQDERLTLLIGADAINKCSTIDELKLLIGSKLIPTNRRGRTRDEHELSMCLSRRLHAAVSKSGVPFTGSR